MQILLRMYIKFKNNSKYDIVSVKANVIFSYDESLLFAMFSTCFLLKFV
jgi:hypothetical protein